MYKDRGCCPTEEEWRRMLPKDLPDPEVEEFLWHMLFCKECYGKFREQMRDAEDRLIKGLAELYGRHDVN